MKSIRKAIKILNVLKSEQREIGISELSHTTGLNISTIHFILSTLIENGYVKQVKKRGKYTLGMIFIEFADVIKRQIRIRDIAFPYMEKLTRLIDEPCLLGIAENNTVLVIERIKSNQALTVEGRTRMDLYNSSVGKVLLAYMTHEEQERYFRNTNLVKETPYTITDIEKLKKQLAALKSQGFFIDFQEKVLGIVSLAAPIKDSNGNVVAALGVTIPSVRYNDAKGEEIELALKGCISEISKAMGYTN
jgi:IclR family KDG regulon transcriptional repressor